MQILKFQDVDLTYFSTNGETPALNKINFAVEKGEFVSIVGPSGCGKTTILSLISGLIKPTAGKILIKNNSNNTYVGYMFQKDNLLEWRTVLGNVYLGLELQKRKTKENITYVENLLKKYNLWEFRNKYPKELSGGMRQRVALIRTLAIKPNILLLDEPFSKLDIDSRINISDDVFNIIKELNITTILITHDISEAITLSNRIIVLTKRPGKIKNIYLLNFITSTPSIKRNTEHFNILYKLVWSDIFNE